MKSPHRDLYRDERHKVMGDQRQDDDCCMSMSDFDEMQKDRTRGVNAEPTEGFRDGVKSVKRMYPDHYIPNPRG